MGKKFKTGLVIQIEKEDRLKLKRRLLELEEIGVEMTASEYASKCFKIGLLSEIVKP